MIFLIFHYLCYIHRPTMTYACMQVCIHMLGYVCVYIHVCLSLCKYILFLVPKTTLKNLWMNKKCQSPSFPQLLYLYRVKQNKSRELLNFEISKPIIKQLKLLLPRYSTDSLCSAINILLQFVQEIRSSHLPQFISWAFLLE